MRRFFLASGYFNSLLLSFRKFSIFFFENCQTLWTCIGTPVPKYSSIDFSTRNNSNLDQSINFFKNELNIIAAKGFYIMSHFCLFLEKCSSKLYQG